MALPDPLPSHLTEPEAGADTRADELGGYLADLADEVGLDPAEVAAEVVLTPSEYEGAAPVVRWAAGWHIDGPRTAEWAMGRYAAADRAIGELAEQAEQWRLRIEAWFQQGTARHQATREFFRQHLQAWALAERDRDPKAKTQHLPSGVVRTTSQSAKVAVLNEEAVVAWADQVLADDADALAAVAPSQRRVLLNGLRDHALLADVPDLAAVLLADGQVLGWHRPGLYLTPGTFDPGVEVVCTPSCPAVGDGWPPDEPSTLVAEVRVLDSHLEVRGPDGLPVPGVGVEPARTTATVTPT